MLASERGWQGRAVDAIATASTAPCSSHVGPGQGAAKTCDAPPVSNYDAEPWHDLFVATAGAGAALTGLVFVAVSINIALILRQRGLPERGLQTVLLLLGSVVVSVFGLVPQTIAALAVETVVVGSTLLAFFAVSLRPVLAGAQGHRRWIATRVLALLPGSATYVVGGISLLIGRGGGLAWLVAGIVGAFVGAIVNAWVLLVEILR